MWEVHCSDGDWFWHEGHGSRCRGKDCTNQDHKVVTHWTLQWRAEPDEHWPYGQVRYLKDTSTPEEAVWFQEIADKLNA
jgi:hypothetical protein